MNGFGTTVRITREGVSSNDPYYAERVRVVVEDEVEAQIDLGGGSTTTGVGGTFTSATFTMTAEPCDIRPRDEVLDLGTGEAYSVEQVFRVNDLSLPHVQAGLEQISAT